MKIKKRKLSNKNQTPAGGTVRRLDGQVLYPELDTQ